MNRIQFLALCCPSTATIKTLIRKEGWGCYTVLQFLWIRLSRMIILSMRRKQLLIINLLKCLLKMFLWRLAPMHFIKLAVYNKVIHFFKIGDLMQVTMANMSIHTHPSAPTAPYRL